IMLWRVSQHRDLAGAGGLRAPGRWHELGMPVVYLAESPAGALLEACVHTSANDVPPNYTLLGVEADARVSLEHLDVSILSADWIKRLEVTRALRCDWLRAPRWSLVRI